MTKPSMPKSLLNAVSDSFDMNELRQLCFAIGVDSEELPQANTKSGMALALIKFADRRGILPQLIQACIEERPHIAWHQLDKGLPIIQAELEEKKNRLYVSTGSITNSQVNIAGQDIVIQRANMDDQTADG